MTTSVIIMSPKPNHQNVRVQTHYLDEQGKPVGPAYSDVTLTDGESTQAYVHGSMMLTVTEIEKE